MREARNVIAGLQRLGLAQQPKGCAKNHSVGIHHSWWNVPSNAGGLRADGKDVSKGLLRLFPASTSSESRSLSRDQLFSFADPKTTTHAELAILIYMWGCGDNDDNVVKFTDLRLEVVESFVSECRGLTESQDLFSNSLFDRLRRSDSEGFRGLNLSFGSKILYFCNVKTNLGDHCGIFDKKVSENIDKITVSTNAGPQKLSHLMFRKDVANKVREIPYSDYETYCNFLEEVAEGSGHSFDDVEYFVFNNRLWQ